MAKENHKGGLTIITGVRLSNNGVISNGDFSIKVDDLKISEMVNLKSKFGSVIGIAKPYKKDGELFADLQSEQLMGGIPSIAVVGNKEHNDWLLLSVSVDGESGPEGVPSLLEQLDKIEIDGETAWPYDKKDC